MKGVVLAGGTGSRLIPLTKITNKHWLPIYDCPMIYFPIRTFVDAGIRDIIDRSRRPQFRRFSSTARQPDRVWPQAHQLHLPGRSFARCSRWTGAGTFDFLLRATNLVAHLAEGRQMAAPSRSNAVAEGV